MGGIPLGDGVPDGITPPPPLPTLLVPPVLDGGLDRALPPPAEGVAGLAPLDEEEAGRAGVAGVPTPDFGAAELVVGCVAITYLVSFAQYVVILRYSEGSGRRLESAGSFATMLRM